MSFSFGQSSFGPKPTGLGAPFGAPTTTTNFGGFGTTTFGQPAASTATGFGNTFGTPVASAAPVFGSTFGTPNPAPSFGASAGTFGAPGPSTAPAFGAPGPSTAPTFGAPGPSGAPSFGTTFGTPSTSAPAFGSTFGAIATSAPTFGTSFGTATSAPSLFGTPAAKPSLFGTPAPTSNLFGTQTTNTSNLFGATTSQAPNLFGSTGTSNLFGTTTTPSLFGSANTFGGGTTTIAPTFSTGLFGSGQSFGTPNVAAGPFGTITTCAPSLFGGFGNQPTNTFGNYGASGPFGVAPTTTTPSNFGFNIAPRPSIIAPALSAAEIKHQQFLSSIHDVHLWGDDRDNTIQKWNMMQASYGTGKGFYSFQLPPCEYDHTNPLYKFKAVAYVVIPTPDNSDGLVKMHFNRKESELSPQKDVLINGIAGILGNRPNLTVNIEHIKSISDTDAEVMISVSEKGVTGASRKIYASDLSAFLNQPIQKQQLTNVGVTFIGPYMAPTKAQINEYLRTPPAGFKEEHWYAAQLDNPNPEKYLPTPVYGFKDLKKRLVCQEYETGLHRAFLEKALNDIMELKRKHVNTIANLNDQKYTFKGLQHRLLKVVVKQETVRKSGMALQPEEEVIRGRMENVKDQLSNATQFRGRLHELMSTVSLLDRLEAGPSTRREEYRMDPSAKEDIRQVLEMEQKGIKEVVKVIHEDLKDLKTIQDGLSETLSGNK